MHWGFVVAVVLASDGLDLVFVANTIDFVGYILPEVYYSV